MEALINRHRPSDFAQVRGHDAVITALYQRITEPEGRPHSYLLTGPSGVGKTTIARLIGDAIAAETIEVDAASNSGVDAMRILVDAGSYLSPGSAARIIIVDECHRLSRQAWDAALKAIEEPPDHLYWALCTTEYTKVPSTIISRCNHVKLGPVADQVMEEFLFDIMVAEGWADSTKPDVFQLVAREAQGSPRLGLSLLEVCHDAESADEARRIIALQGTPEPMRMILRQLVSGQGSWETIRPLLAQLADDEFTEGALIGAGRYICTAMVNTENPDRARRIWELLSALTFPVTTHDIKAQVYAGLGRYFWSAV